MPLQVERRRRPSLAPQLEPLRRITLECQGATPIEYGLPPLTYQTIVPPSPRRRPSEHQSPIPMDYGLPPPTYQTIAPPKQPTLQRKPTLPTQTQVQNVRSSGQKEEIMEFDRIRLIGQGGEGEAWLMRSVADNSLVVRKVFRDWPQKGGEPLEVKILNEILPKHRSLISLYYYSLKPEEHQLHMYYEYCSGGSLDSLIPKGKPGSLPESFIWHVFIQLAEALEVLHHLGTQKVVHRDVKPDNVFLGIPYTPNQSKNSYPSLRLGDFGLATLSTTTSGSGTYMWMGPEVPQASAKGDIWGLGAIIHALAHGKGPIDMDRRNWQIDSRARKAQSLPSRYSDALNKNMTMCLQWKPHDRVSSRDLMRNLRRNRP